MTGLHNGLQARVRNLYPKMHFHWCSGHCLNLCLAKACEKVKKVVDHVQEITIAFKYSAKREQLQYFKEAILADSESAQPLGRKNMLVMLSETQWSARGESFSTVKDGLFPLIHSLEKLEENNDDKAKGLLTGILQFYFIVSVFIIASASVPLGILSSKLQYDTLDLNDASVS